MNAQPNALSIEPQWRQMIQIGAVSAAILAALVVLAIIAYLIWPYAPDQSSVEDVFQLLQSDLLGGLAALDISLLLTEIFNVLLMLALYIALRSVNATWALIALVLGLLSAAALLPSRPIVELVILSNAWAAAGAAGEPQTAMVAAGEALLPLFHGTSWAVFTTLNAASFLISAVLMLRSPLFSRITAWTGIVTTVTTLMFFLPGLGALILFISTLASIAWTGLLARDFYRIWRGMGEG
jgi:hypothetical protein